MAAAPPPAPPPITAIDLLQFSEIVDNARTDGERGQNTGVVATANDGRPDVALKGSLMVLDADHLAWWERSRAETEAAVRANPHAAVMVRNIVRDRRTLRFYVEARIVDDPALRARIWERVVQVEKDTDPEKNGVAVLVRVDRVRAGKFDIQRR
ncbi:MAG: pyridoxamine 5'-phosphate oxidase family protein [Chloroflexi bacterium]|nr:MAG: pyridoxamine 5'-phosphate oxidase family protein [Chloroflexota bacterium]TME85213.1 MAG: pyridoxamine 5'-phosphate oxidase family protein [Chloroflexota bacterium]